MHRAVQAMLSVFVSSAGFFQYSQVFVWNRLNSLQLMTTIHTFLSQILINCHMHDY